jgi:hypothetical protein
MRQRAEAAVYSLSAEMLKIDRRILYPFRRTAERGQRRFPEGTTIQ